MASGQFSLSWENFHKNMTTGINVLLQNEDLVDVTLVVEGKYLKAHKLVLSVCSPCFRELFKMNPCKHPIVFMKDVSYFVMSDLLQFMYQGEVQINQENLKTFVKTAEELQIKGLTGDRNGLVECEKAQKCDEEVHQTTTTPAKLPRLSVPEQEQSSASPNAIPKTEAATASSVPSNDNLKPDDNPDETFIDDGNKNHSVMECGEEEPQAGTSTEATDVGQSGVIRVTYGQKNPILLLKNNRYTLNDKYKYKTWWRCSFKSKTRCNSRLCTYGKVVEIHGNHNHEGSTRGKYSNHKIYSQNVIFKRK